jgi:hypothetical protein
LNGEFEEEVNEMKMPRFTAEVSLYKTNGHYQMITQRAGLGDGLAVVPQSSCDTYAEVAMQYGYLAWKASGQGDIWLAYQYYQEYQNWAAQYQACEATASRL